MRPKSVMEQSATVVFDINPQLDTKALRATFQEHGRLHIPNFLNVHAAAALHRHLAEDIEWGYFVFKDNHLWEVPAERRRLYSEEDDQKLSALAHAEGRSGYAFLYETNPLTARKETGQVHRASHSALLQQFISFLNSKQFMEFARSLTGTDDIEFAEATATCFRPGHFLAFHDDSCAKSRRIAYVLNLVRTWKPEWGGLLEFMGSNGHIAEAYVPRFNAFNVFRVPQAHAVSYVSPLAGEPRFAISGWLHARVPGTHPNPGGIPLRP